ncbi:MAG TPA: hypothetical protein VMR62_18565 [Bryobacteraceae bacterium]|nr:hypothetical protein [Bryobacteraceae bacterium]
MNITARIYAHALPDDDRRAADTWDNLNAITGAVIRGADQPGDVTGCHNDALKNSKVI